jgi:prevent-host-death family protein
MTTFMANASTSVSYAWWRLPAGGFMGTGRETIARDESPASPRQAKIGGVSCQPFLSLYIVHMQRFSAAAARQRFSEVLDAAEKGEGVVIERRGVQFELVPRKPARGHARSPSLVEWADPAVERGQWTWASAADGLAFTARRRAK